MVCVQCGSKTSVENSRHQIRTNRVWRRRQCQKCGTVFTTEEQIDYSGIWRVRPPKGPLRPFERDKLFVSLLRSCQHRKTAISDAVALTDTVINKLLTHIEDGVIESGHIIEVAQVALSRFDNAAGVHYAAYHRS